MATAAAPEVPLSDDSLAEFIALAREEVVRRDGEEAARLVEQQARQSTALAWAVTASPPAAGMTPEQEQRVHAAARGHMLALLAAEGRDRIAGTRRTFTSRIKAVVVRLVRATRSSRTSTARRTASHSSTRTASTADGGGEPGEPAGPPRSLAEVERRPTEGNRKQPAPARPEVAA